jgi:hypothetical protein
VKKQPYGSLREFGEFCITAGMFFMLVALFGIYLFYVGLNAVYCAILRLRQSHSQSKDCREFFV